MDRRRQNKTILRDTLDVLYTGKGPDGKDYPLGLTLEQMKKAVVLMQDTPLPDERLREPLTSKTVFECINTDSFSAALEMMKDIPEEEKVLVLNFANAFHPGGGVRRGASAQEEDLCRCSSLLLSVESEEAEKFYDYHNRHAGNMATAAVILNPYVAVIRDSHYALLDQPVTVSVITCAAPDLRLGLCGMSVDEYKKILYDRIMRILQTAAAFGYRELVLGAFGCGVFGNDAELVARLFAEAFRKFSWQGMNCDACFRHVVFAVLDRSEYQYNYRHFNARFGRKQPDVRDRIRGSLFAGAAGDALGYAVEFMKEDGIFRRYGEQGITEYDTGSTGKAIISDDTQMTLFTAEGFLRQAEEHYVHPSQVYIAEEYQSWLVTQENDYPAAPAEGKPSRLLQYEELFSARAPGITCLNALGQLKGESGITDYIAHVTNNSKGCGGIMRAAPAGCLRRKDIRENDMEAAQLAAVTHHHPLGYMSASVLAHIVNRLVFPQGDMTLPEIIKEAEETVCDLFKDTDYCDELREIIDLSVRLAGNDSDDLTNIHQIGGGWVGEEALGIAVYCSLKYQNDLSKALIVSVNHSGDSDSTGEVTGNILGALHGYEAIEEKWKKGLEISDLILDTADRLADLAEAE